MSKFSCKNKERYGVMNGHTQNVIAFLGHILHGTWNEGGIIVHFPIYFFLKLDHITSIKYEESVFLSTFI